MQSKTRQKMIRITDQHDEMLEVIRNKFNLVTDSEVVRFCISRVFNQIQNEEKNI